MADAAKFAEGAEKLRLFLEETNRHVNLTRLTGEKDFYIKHVIDSLAPGKYFPEYTAESAAVADIGCGAGFPSLILALAYPQLRLTAIDSTGKKIAFVAAAAKMLNLKNLHAVQGRSTEMNCKAEFRHRFDLVVARAVAPAPRIVADSDNFLRKSGKYVLYKTPDQASEDLPVLRKMGGNWQQSDIFELPEDAGRRCFVFGNLL